MNTRQFAQGLALALVVLALGGCMSFNPRSLRQMESELRDSNPELEFEATMKFGVGPLTMDLIDFAFVHDEHIDLSKISRADIGIYEVKGGFEHADFRVPPGNARNCPQRDVILRVTEEHERVEIAVCSRSGKLTGFTLFVLDRQEIVVINTRGDIKGLVSSAIRGQMQPRRVVASAPHGAPQS